MTGYKAVDDNYVEIVKKWYQKLSFPKKYDGEFENLVGKVQVCGNHDISTYQFSHQLEDGGINLVMCLYFCEALEEKYTNFDIPHNILYDTLSDLVYWTNIHYDLTGKLGISEVDWVKNHLSGKLFRLGRLQYCFGVCFEDIKDIGIIKGEKIMEVHIPGGEALDIEKCKASVENARYFFDRYFPQEEYKCFTCSSWLLDDTLINLMKESSNIIQFQRMFTPISKKESYAVLKYSINWNARKENIEQYKPMNSFTERVVKHISDGGMFYSGYGYIKK